jgi:hypothetical protein
MLYVNKDNIVRDIKDLCKSLQIHELTKLRVSFREIDWYDDEVDVYTTPIVLYDCITDSIKHGERQHGSIPKDWSVYLILEFTDIKTAEPLLTTIKYILGGLFTADVEKDLLDKLKKVSLPQ